MPLIFPLFFCFLACFHCVFTLLNHKCHSETQYWSELSAFAVGTTGRKWSRRRSRPFFARPTDRWTRRSELEDKKRREEMWKKKAKPEERRGGGTRPEKDERQRAPPILSLGLNADLFKRIVHRLANLPAASAAEPDGANVMRAVALPACVPADVAAQGRCTAPQRRMLSHTHTLLAALTGHRVVTYFRASRGSPTRRLNAPDGYFRMKCHIFWC